MFTTIYHNGLDLGRMIYALKLVQFGQEGERRCTVGSANINALRTKTKRALTAQLLIRNAFIMWVLFC